MKPSTIWIAIVLLAVGVCGLLDATGIVDSGQTIGEWWPIAVVGWALAEMLGGRRVTLGGLVCAAFGLALLADAQAWASDALVWSSLAIFIGAAVLVDAIARRGDHRGAHEVRSLSGGGAS
jgi:sugar phosphate permease